MIATVKGPHSPSRVRCPAARGGQKEGGTQRLVRGHRVNTGMHRASARRCTAGGLLDDVGWIGLVKKKSNLIV